LEQENDDVANEYIETKLDLTRKLEESRDECNVAKNELIRCKNDYQIRINDSQDTNTKLTNELEELKKIWRSQSEKYESDLERNGVIIQEYKQICNTLSNKVVFFYFLLIFADDLWSFLNLTFLYRSKNGLTSKIY